MFSWDQWDATERFISGVRWEKAMRVDFETIQAYFAIRGWIDCGQCFKILEKETATHSSILAWKIPLSQTYIYLFFDCVAHGIFVPQLPGASTWDPTHDKVMRRRPDRQGRSGPQWFRKAAPALTLKMITVFLMLAILDHSLISVTQVDGLPRSLSKQNQLRTWINMSPGRQYPIRLSRMKGVFQFRPLCWHSSLLGKCVLMHMTAHNTLIRNSIKNLITLKALTGTEPFRRWGSPMREHKNFILKVVIVKDLEK